MVRHLDHGLEAAVVVEKHPSNQRGLVAILTVPSAGERYLRENLTVEGLVVEPELGLTENREWRNCYSTLRDFKEDS